MRLKNGMARVEFFAVRVEAEALLAKGYPATSIYKSFRNAGRISMSYRTFWNYLKGTDKHVQTDPPRKDALASKSQAGSAPAPKPQKPKVAPAVPSGGPIRIGGNQEPDAWKKAAPSMEDLTIARPVKENT